MPNDWYEKTVEDIIFENKDIIHEYGLPKFRKTTFRQFILPSGRKLDIISYDLVNGHLVMDLYELKRFDINTDAIVQAYNYLIELNGITAGKFKSVDIHIIMIGSQYNPVLMFQRMNLPFSVYTYEYKLTGMKFFKHQEKRNPYKSDDSFSLGLWAFGSGMMQFNNGQPNTVNMADLYNRKKTELIHNELIMKTGSMFKAPVVIEVPVIKYTDRPSIVTEVFPRQPSWTKEFARSIPPDEYMFDFEEDMSDWEPEIVENDRSDYEPETLEDNEQPPYSPTIEERDYWSELLTIESERIEQEINQKSA